MILSPVPVPWSPARYRCVKTSDTDTMYRGPCYPALHESWSPDSLCGRLHSDAAFDVKPQPRAPLPAFQLVRHLRASSGPAQLGSVLCPWPAVATPTPAQSQQEPRGKGHLPSAPTLATGPWPRGFLMGSSLVVVLGSQKRDHDRSPVSGRLGWGLRVRCQAMLLKGLS